MPLGVLALFYHSFLYLHSAPTLSATLRKHLLQRSSMQHSNHTQSWYNRLAQNIRAIGIIQHIMTHLIVGLGNIGAEYAGTRHNIGFDVVDQLAADAGATWEDRRYGAVCTIRVKNQVLVLLKPSTYMNLSGDAVRYWMKEKNVDIAQMLVVVDDLALPFGQLRMKGSGSEAGHNGLRHITQVLGTQGYNRLRFGIGNDFPRGGQVDFVLGHFEGEDLEKKPEALARAAEAVKSFALQGLARTMNQFNR